MTAYCTSKDLRDEGFSRQVSKARLDALIAQASAFIEQATGRFFEPRSLTLTLDGTGTPDLLLDLPIIAVHRLFGTPASSGYQVSNRHLTQGLLSPDDRDHPKIRLARGCFPQGTQNIRVEGVFGYTEPDGTPTGRTPRLIVDVCKKLVVRNLPRLSDTSAREEAQKRFRLLEEKTREQSYKLDRLAFQGPFTGDPEIDTVLLQFTRPAALGAA